MFDDRDRHARTPAHDVALTCLEAGIAASLPERVVPETVALDGETLRVRDTAYDLDDYERLLVLGAGKAAGGVAAVLESILGDRIDGGVVVSTDGAETDRIAVHSGDHPTPAERNVRATERALDLARSADADTLVLAIVTGWASALWCAPAPGLDLADLRETADALLACGAPIDAVNAVRTRCSAIKGGRLGEVADPAMVCTLAISDVVGDDPAVIGSGPTVPPATGIDDASTVVERYGLEDRLPAAVLDHCSRPVVDRPASPPTAHDPTDDYHLLATTATAIEAAREAAEDAGYEPLVLSSSLRGEAREVGRVQAAVAEEIGQSSEPVAPPAVVLSGGEVTVTVRGEGIGGPNAELALAGAMELGANGTAAVLASVDTDGVDGPTDAAGAIVDRETVNDAAQARLALDRNDSAIYLAERDALLRTGYTGTNVNDLRVLVVEDPS